MKRVRRNSGQCSPAGAFFWQNYYNNRLTCHFPRDMGMTEQQSQQGDVHLRGVCEGVFIPTFCISMFQRPPPPSCTASF